MNISFFLGANSKDGFVSLYDNFAAGSGDKLHIIKSGPGTGKSGFMRAIGYEAEVRGYDVQYILCSGDPASLDGVYIPALHEAWVDGTAPHVTEPRLFGIDSDYVNLGVFCSKGFSANEQQQVTRLFNEYRGLYKRAYAYLNAVGGIERAFSQDFFNEEDHRKVRKRVRGIIGRAKLTQSPCPTFSGKCFLSAVSCQGLIYLNESITDLCKLIYTVDNRLGGAQYALSCAAEEAELKGAKTVLCLSPIDPGRLEAVLIPERSLAFVNDEWNIENARHIRLDAMAEQSLVLASRSQRRTGERIRAQLLYMALEKLKGAKLLHDELESIYIRHMDFSALDEFIASEKARVFN